MPDRTAPKPDVNSWFEDELYTEYLHDQKAVDAAWKNIFETTAPKTNGGPANGGAVSSAPPAPAEAAPPATVKAAPPAAGVPVHAPPALVLGPSEQLVPLKGAAARLAANMTASLAVPTATSQRQVPVKVIEENRRLINQAREMQGKSKVSYTHLLGWAIVQALESHPGLNDAYAEQNGEGFRLVRKAVNLGIAIDVAGAGGARSLVVPSIKNAGTLDFAGYMAKFDDLVQRGRKAKLTVDDFQGTTISITNPGTVGTQGSVPRLMPGQGCIIASGAMDYPSEFAGMSRETLAMLGVSKTMTLTCTYDHRIIQGAESGTFLGRLQDLLQGDSGFYEDIFASLRLPYRPVHWEADRRPALAGALAAPRKEEIAKEAAVLQLINAYRVRGHLIADLNPLGQEPSYHPELDPATYGFSLWDLDREFITGNLGALMGEAAPKPVATLREILDTLRQTYCGKIGCEYMSIQFPEQKAWLQQRMEPQANNWPLSPEEKVRVLERLVTAERFENFLASRFVGQKRFGLEGAESAIAILDAILERAADSGAHEVIIGMAHRGRLNVLANTVGKPIAQIFSEFEGHPDPESTQGSGDVKYHLGATGVHRSAAGKEVMVSMAPNPSHLEAVNPVVEGIVRAKQARLGDTTRQRILPVLLHGDAAFVGQGVVTETLNLSQLHGYRTGGTVHVVINNQIGFTTNPMDSRSTVYCTDVARMVQAPIFHVNGDDPEACVRALQVALDFRQQFKKDVVLDMICYRRHGHNEADDPSYTQPIMYRRIAARRPVSELYAERLIRENVATAEQVERLRKRITSRLEDGFEEAKQYPVKYEVQELGVADSDGSAAGSSRTAVDRALLDRVIEALTVLPDSFHLHPKLKGFIEKRKTALDTGMADWALGEALAFGTLCLEGTGVRLSGQDSGRGTFSQRHLTLVDSESGEPYRPLKSLGPEQANFSVYDSSLSEYAVMGFEFGYTVGDPRTLVLWEAQFGDFVNGAQVMIDQFLSVSGHKWGQPSGLVLLLPHGFEGQGPEHSSARIERFLTLCAEDNMFVANCTTPAQYFHILRRQIHGGADRRGVRKPLILFTPKSLLRHPRVVSRGEEFTSGAFREVLGETSAVAADRISRVLICSGKIYYDLLHAREERRADHVAILRMEQLYPFPKKELRDHIFRYPDTADVVWVQEEPLNMGPWRVISDFIQPLLDSSRRHLRYIGRTESASPAAGSYKTHNKEQHDIIDAAFSPDKISPVKKVRVVRPRRIKAQ